MAYSDFRDKLKLKREEAELKYKENSEEAWGQVKSFFSDPSHWIVFGIALLLFVAGFFTVKFLAAIRAPSLPGESGPITLGEPSELNGPEDPYEVIDDSNAVQPILSGARKEDFYTFLLFATDAASGSTDTLMVVSYDVKNQKVNLMSIPRDTMVNVSWDIKKINSVYSMSGLSGLKKHIGKLIGFVPDYYVKVDVNAFIEVVDLIGGVDFEVPRAMNYDDPVQNLHIHFQPGMQHLNGQQAMEVVRWRKNNPSASGSVAGYDDVGRIQTQQAFLKAALGQALSIRNWTKITGYVEIFERYVDSDLELGNMLWFARRAMDLSEDGFASCTIPGDYYASAWSRTFQSMQSYVTLYPQQVIRLVNEKFNPYLAQVSTANLDVMSINSDGSVSSSTGYVADSIAALPPVLAGTEKPEESDPDGETEPGEAGGETVPGGATGEPGGAGGETTPGATTGEPGGAGGGTAPGGTLGEPGGAGGVTAPGGTPGEPGGANGVTAPGGTADEPGGANGVTAPGDTAGEPGGLPTTEPEPEPEPEPENAPGREAENAVPSDGGDE